MSEPISKAHTKDAKPPDRGRLTIFLGYACGVGKTRAMLDRARQQQAGGVDVMAVAVDTHGQAETVALLAALEVLQADGTDIPLDGLLARRPDLTLVDELARTNPPGARHPRRYQDVLELLDAGIDIYTTLNIQHLESLNDVIAQITGTVVRETVPDHLFDAADVVELVDISVDELLQRLAAGKVKVPAGSEDFFRRGNLTALRELALRRTAERVDEQMRAYMQSHGIVGPWPAGERLLVCVGPSPLSERLVRTARRLATRLDAEWFALYVETPAHARLSEAARDRLAHTLRLAEELGAKSMTLPGRSIADTVTDFAERKNISKIVVGQPLSRRWSALWRGSIADQLIHRSQEIDVYVISSAPPARGTGRQQARPARARWRRFLQSATLVATATIIGLPLRPFIEPTNLVMLYLVAVVIAALRLGHTPAILASLLSVIAFDLIFVPPFYTFVVADAQYLLTFGGLLGVGLLISNLAAHAREQARAAQRRELQTAVLYELSRDLAVASDLAGVAGVVVNHTEQILEGAAAVLLEEEGTLVWHSAGRGFRRSDEAYAAARWVYEHGRPAGQGTDTLADAGNLYLPLETAQDVVGVLAVTAEREIDGERRRLLDSFASQAALAIERSRLADAARRARLLQETEKLQSALLNSISHDLRTPLATITGTLTSLRDDRALLDEAAQRELLDTAYEEATRLNRLVGNLLDMTRLEAGAMRITTAPASVEDLVGVVLNRLSPYLGERAVSVSIPHDLPLVPIDFVLMAEVLANLLENALKYAPPANPVEIGAYLAGDVLCLEVADRGPGIPPDALERIFDKFYRVTAPGMPPGIGLGLSISKGIVEAHGGRIWARNREEGGAAFTVSLPLADSDTYHTEA